MVLTPSASSALRHRKYTERRLVVSSETGSRPSFGGKAAAAALFSLFTSSRFYPRLRRLLSLAASARQARNRRRHFPRSHAEAGQRSHPAEARPAQPPGEGGRSHAEAGQRRHPAKAET